MITEDAMEIYEEPDSSQSCSTVLLLREAAGKSQNDRRYAGVGWQCSSTNLALKRLREEYQRNLQPLGNPDSGRSDEHAPVAPRDRSLSRAPGDPKHPARIPRNTVYFPKTQDPEALEAKQLFKTKALGVQIQAIETAKLKAAKQHRLQQKENEDSSRRFTLRRRHTAEVAQPAPHPSRRKAALKGTITDLNVSYLRRRASLASEAVEGQPIAGPSRLFDHHPFPPPALLDEEDDEDGMPASTPSPHPRLRSQKRGTYSASPSFSSSASKNSSSQFSAFSELPTSLDHAPLTRRHSVDLSTSFSISNSQPAPLIERQSSTRSVTREPALSLVIPSPAALAAHPIVPPEPIPHPPTPAPLLTLPSPSPLIPEPPTPSFHTQALPPAPARSHPIPRPSQFPSPSWPYVMPTSTPSASQPRVIRVSQRWPPALGMRPLVRPGAGKYQVPRENPKAIVGFKVPFKHGAGNRTSADVPKRSQTSNTRPQVAKVGPPRATVLVLPAPARAQVAPDMSARRAEPVSAADGPDAMDEVKEADSSYGDVPFDFDPEALDEAMSMYDP
ncbi:hypothetical protein C8Q79DRAFT_1011935 [Trametes meyenii]|nr:hypothetical protein C8Q79DRAFT_1011935 [Trametes meyenii]